MQIKIGDLFGHFTRQINTFCSSPAATVLAFFSVIVWVASGPHYHYSDAWQLIINTGTTIITFLMVFVLNNAQSRDTAAINAKLDAIIYAIEAADKRMIGLENQTENAARLLRDEVLADVEATPAEDEG
jgi:low affinity Fe/Cu permease